MRPDERFRTWQVAKTVFFLTIFSALKKYSALAFPRDFCFAPADQWEKFRAKTQAFLLAHQQHVTVLKLRTNQVLTMEDLERLLMESGIVGEEEISRAKSESEGLGLFVRSLVGLDREAAKEAIAGFLSGKTLDANQIQFVNMVVNHLTQYGMMDASLLYQSPFTDLASEGPAGNAVKDFECLKKRDFVPCLAHPHHDDAKRVQRTRNIIVPERGRKSGTPFPVGTRNRFPNCSTGCCPMIVCSQI